MSDIYMRIMMGVTGSDIVLSAVRDIAKSLGGGGLGKALGNLTFGFRNLGTDGTIGTDALKAGFSSAGKIILETAAIAGVAIAGVSIALGVDAVKAAGDFQAQTERLVTSAGELQSNLDMVRSGVLKMSVDTATSTQQLAQGMYYVESSGYHAASGLQVLKAAAQGAKSENADLDTVTKALTTELVDYHMKSTMSAQAMNGLIATVQNGKTSLQDLSSSMGNVLPIASALGISFPQVAGSMDTMTNAGMSAHQASMNLSHVLLALSSPSSVAVKSMTAVGLSAQGVKNALVNQGLPEALQMIEDSVGKKFPVGSVAYETAVKNITGGMMGFKLAAMLTGGSLAETKANIDKVSAAMKSGSKGVMGFAEVQSTFNFKVDQAKQALGVFMIQLGTQLMPVFTKLMNVLFPIIQGFLKWVVNSGILKTVLQTLVNGLIFLVNSGSAVTSFFKHNAAAMEALKVVLIVLATAIGVVLVGAMYLWISAAIMAGVANLIAFWPVYLVVAAIVVVIALVVLAVMHWGQITAWFGQQFSRLGGFIHLQIQIIGAAFSMLGTWIHNVFSAIGTGIGNFFSMIGSIAHNGMMFLLNTFLAPFRAIGALFSWLYQHNTYFQRLVDAIKHIISVGVAFLRRVWTNIVNEITGLWHGLVNTATTVWNAITGAIRTAWNAVVGVVTGIWQKISAVFTGAWNTYIAKPVASLWSKVTSAFGNAWNTISQKLSSLWSSISGWFGNLASQAIQWGANLISGFLKGVQNALGGIGKTLGNVGGKIASFLGFHSPTKEGPGRDADKWAPNLMAMYAKGLQAGIPQLQTSLNMVMRPVVGTLGAVPATGVARPMAPAPVASGHTFNLYISTMAGSPAEIRRFANLIQQELGRQFRATTPGYAAGGLY